MAQRRTHREMYEAYKGAHEVTPELRQEMIGHLEAIREEGRTSGPIVRAVFRPFLSQRAREADEILEFINEDDSDEWLKPLLQEFKAFFRREQEE